MQVYYDLDKLPAFRNAVVTIGSFDGVHRGHQQLLSRIQGLARECGGESVVVTFHPHPRQVIYPGDESLRLLTTTAEKVALFERYGVDNVVVVPFTVEFSRLSADEYIEKFLVGRFAPRYVVIGYDHRFGLNRQGDIHYLKWYAADAGFEVIEIEPQEIDDIAVSSTKVRQALEEGRVARAARLLGHSFVLTGRVVAGAQVGRSLGFPTANLQIGERHKLIPPDGIYAVRIVYGSRRYDGMLYIGTRPSLQDGDRRSIEVNIFQFDQTIYGEELQLEFVDYIRGDRSFDSLEQLQNQMAADRDAARRILGRPEVNTEKKKSELTRTAVVILNFNGRDYLEKFLPSVIRHSPAGTAIYVADNGSSDGSLAYVVDNFPDIFTLDLGQNYGFAEGYNQALHQIEADIYVLLNSDVEVTANWLTPCLEAMQDEGVAACQPKIRACYQRDHFEYAGAAGGFIDQLGYPFCRGRIFGHTEPDKGQYDEPAEIFWASGAALFVRARLFHELGGFDGDYFAHAEEIDLCWRLKRAGYRVVVRPDSVVYHVGGGTLSYNTPRKAYLNFRNTLVTSFKNEPAAKLIWWLPVRLLLDGVAGMLFLSQGKFRHIFAIVQAHWHFFPRLGYWLRKRRDFNRRINQHRYGPDRTGEGRFNDSIVLHYYLLARTEFSRLPVRFSRRQKAKARL